MREYGLIDRLGTVSTLNDLRAFVETGDAEETIYYLKEHKEVILRSLDDALLAIDENRTYADRLDSYKEALKHSMKWKDLATSALGIIQDYSEE